jgi:NAD(P)-dependent dehydrogenase (short-subunit alcohol dehydrogenase family)
VLNPDTENLRSPVLPEGTAYAPIEADLTGRVAVVTGATSGIGREVAHGLARLGARVVLVGRSQDKADSARAELVARGVDPDRLETAVADLSRLSEVAGLGRDLARRLPRLDVLVNNAGCYPGPKVITPEGFEESWATNVLAYDLLTQLLQGSLRGARGRLVFVSSSMARNLDLDDLLWKRRRWSGMKAYAQSKQADTMLAWSWERRFAGSGVTVNVAHPDGTATNIAHRQRGLWGLVTRIAFSTQRTPAEGADTILWLAAAPELQGSGGGFYVRRRTLPGQFRDDLDSCDELARVTAEQLAPFLPA